MMAKTKLITMDNSDRSFQNVTESLNAALQLYALGHVL